MCVCVCVCVFQAFGASQVPGVKPLLDPGPFHYSRLGWDPEKIDLPVMDFLHLEIPMDVPLLLVPFRSPVPVPVLSPCPPQTHP